MLLLIIVQLNGKSNARLRAQTPGKSTWFCSQWTFLLFAFPISNPIPNIFFVFILFINIRQSINNFSVVQAKAKTKAENVRKSFCWCFAIFQIASGNETQKRNENQSWKNICQLSNYYQATKSFTRTGVKKLGTNWSTEIGKSVVNFLFTSHWRVSLHRGEFYCTIRWNRNLVRRFIKTPDVTCCKGLCTLPERKFT